MSFFLWDAFYIIVLDDYHITFAMLLKADKIMRNKVECRFGYSKISKIFITIVVIVLVIFVTSGFLIGHCIITSLKKYEIINYKLLISNYIVHMRKKMTNTELANRFVIERLKRFQTVSKSLRSFIKF